MNHWSRPFAYVSGAVLVAGLAIGAAGADAGASERGSGAPPEQDLIITGASTIYPNRADATDPHGTTFAFVPTHAGRWILKVHFASTRTRNVGCADLEESTAPVEWRWDGLDGDFKAPPRGRAYAELTYSQFGGCRTATLVGQSDWVTIVNSTGHARQGDRSDHADVRHVDLGTWSLTNSAKRVVAELTFYQRQRRELWQSMFTLIGTPRTGEGDTHAYQITYFRDPPPGWSRWMLGYTVPGEFDTAVHPIRCRGFKSLFTGRRVIVTVPKRCMDHGSRKLKMGVVYVQDRHGHEDHGGASSEFVHYSGWSIYRPVR